MKLRFVGNQKVTGDVTSFVFQPEQPVSWQAGQYFHYLFPHPNEDDRGHERWFTNSAAPSESKVMISTRIAAQKGSSFKQALQNLKQGDEIEADGPKGSFVIEDPARNYIWVAGGIGITPFRSMLAEADTKSQQFKIDLLYANRDPANIPFKDELDQYSAKNPNLKIEYISEPNRIDASLIKQRIDSTENPLVYISGPEPMVKDFAEKLKELGMSEDILKLDDFPGYETY
ncbi:MAG TPA: FAD-dependent oxidoreductase [Candidatus Saccharimonadales bacterium]|nr:FAD-dependent oxidoreductase [Candidatus Saccharimonadales bacterium]